MPPACHPEEHPDAREARDVPSFALPTKDPDGARWDVLPYTDKPALRRGRDPSLREAMTALRAVRVVEGADPYSGTEGSCVVRCHK